MVTLPTTASVVPSDIPIANLLRIAMQRVVGGEEMNADARRVLGAFVNFAMEVPVAAPRAPIAHTPSVGYTAKAAEEGYYLWFGRYVKVQMNQAGTNTYAKTWEVDSGTWEYAEGLVRKLTIDHKLTAEAAAKFGALYGRCIFCSQQLNDERSIAAGYGEICADNHGLPWG